MSSVVAVVGAGPTGTSFVERLLANVEAVAPAGDLVVHLIDPHPPGGGRVWRSAQSALLRMNSMAEDVTMFLDESVDCDGPVRPGPSLAEWIETEGCRLRDRDLAGEARAADSRTFPTRRLQSAYLGWVFDTVVASAPPWVQVEVHQATVVDLDDGDHGRQVVHLDDGSTLEADVVVLALGHLDVGPDDTEQRLASFADRHRLAYVPSGYTADVRLDAIEAGATVILRGTGLAFVDAVVLLTEGRGGRFVTVDGGHLCYLASGDEPLIVTGSRRGLPYRSKIGYRLQGPRPELPRFLTTDAVDAILDANRPTDFRRHLWPLVAKELGWAHYHELFHAHPEATARPWDEFDRAWAAAEPGEPALAAMVDAAVPDPADRFAIDALDAPLAGVRVGSFDDLQVVVHDAIEADLARKADPRHSADVAVFDAMLVAYLQIMRAVGTGRLAARSRVEDVNGWWHGLFSTYASGPPPFRLRELLALARAGVVRFLGAGIEVEADERRRRFVATSASAPGQVEAQAMVEARLPRIDLARVTDPLLGALLARGEVTEHVLRDDDGTEVRSGKVAVTAAGHLVIGSSGGHPRRVAIGVHTSRPAAGAFARPRTNAVAFRQHDAVARSVLATLATLPAPQPAGA